MSLLRRVWSGILLPWLQVLYNQVVNFDNLVPHFQRLVQLIPVELIETYCNQIKFLQNVNIFVCFLQDVQVEDF